MKVKGKAESGRPAIKVCVAGGGWYGCHIALELAKKGYEVTLKERNKSLFSEISGQFGIRLHTGQHYPRSEVTRKSCRQGYMAFCAKYPQLVVSHEFSHYALGVSDADGKPPKVDETTFQRVCHEGVHCESYYTGDRLDKERYPNIQALADIPEPSIKVGRGLAGFFEEKLQAAGVRIEYGHEVKSVARVEPQGQVEKLRVTAQINPAKLPPGGGEARHEDFDYVVNATNYQSVKPDADAETSLPFGVVYQTCLAIVVEDTQPTSEKPFSKIIMDGFNPCLMPIVEYGGEEDIPADKPQQYILTHGKYTIGGSHATPEAAQQQLKMFTDRFMHKHVKPLCIAEMERYMPGFSKRFKVKGFRKAVLTKPVANTEYRGALTVRNDKTGVIDVIAGKVSNISDAGKEVLKWIAASEGKDEKVIKSEPGRNYSYLVDGTFDKAQGEFKERIADPTQNTCMLQTYDAKGLIKSKPKAKEDRPGSATVDIGQPTNKDPNQATQTSWLPSTMMPSMSANKVAKLLFVSSLMSILMTRLGPRSDDVRSFGDGFALILLLSSMFVATYNQLGESATVGLAKAYSFWREASAQVNNLRLGHDYAAEHGEKEAQVREGSPDVEKQGPFVSLFGGSR